MAVENILSVLVPILAFLLVFVVVFAVLGLTGVLESKGLNLFISLLVALGFVLFAGARSFVIAVVPWFAVLVVCFLFIMVLVKFSGADFLHKWIGIAFVILLAIGFLISAYVVFSSSFDTVLYGGSGFLGAISPAVWGGILLVIVAAIASWVLVKFG